MLKPLRTPSRAVAAASIAALVTFGGAAVQAQNATTVRIASGLTRPIYVTHAPGDASRTFIVEQRGSAGVSTRGDVKILDLATNTILPTPFLSITGLTTQSEQGVLGMAFAPDYATSGRFFMHYTAAGGTTTIARYTVSANPNIANPTPEAIILTVSQPASNHNGGWMDFGPDGYLYVALGDGGGSGDPGLNGQNPNTLLGTILRLDVSGPTYTSPPSNPFIAGGGRPEVWAWGLRNPWRSSFDRLTGDLWIADVGQNSWEEINFQPAIGNPPYIARNYGWRCFEGNAVFSSTGACPPAGPVQFPVHVYPIASQPECAITGGYVYRGCDLPAERGNYFFADYCSAKIWSFRLVNGVPTNLRNRTAEFTPSTGAITWISSFGQDARGELYIVSHLGGAIFKMVPRCSANCDDSTVPPVLNVDDFTCFINRFALGDCWANCDGSTVEPVLNVDDFTCFINRFALGCP
jgi:glucose/arabinose dehydrogenase